MNNGDGGLAEERRQFNARIRELERERDELLSALKAITDTGLSDPKRMHWPDRSFSRARALIAKLETKAAGGKR